MDWKQAAGHTAWSKMLARKTELEGKTLISWSQSGRAKGIRFTIEEISTAAIEVSGKTFKSPRRISRSDFEYIADKWSSYLNGRLRRDELNRSQNTTYILTILHWLDSN